MLFNLLLYFSFMLIFMKHPLSLGFLIFIQIIWISILMGMFYNFWYSYIMILVFIGGLLILFIYMTSIASNEKFKTNFYLILSFSLIIFSTMMFWIKANFNLNNFLYKNILTNQDHLNNFLPMSKFLIFPQNKIFFITIIYLLISMIASIKICKYNYGPLRQMFYDIWYDKPMRKNSNILNILNNSLIDLPSPSNISYMWNFGSLLGMCLMIQILTGIFLVMHYCPDINLAFNSVSHICSDTNYGWLIRIIHANGASMFFICLYMHMGRGIYYSSYKYTQTWTIGIIILLMSMATAFLGYVLPWGQMSFWGATVITNLFSAIPYIGNSLVYWLWGGFAVDNATLSRFFSLHYLLPFIITSLILIHLMYLHQTGSSNPLGVNSNLDKIPFHPYFSYKDLLGMMMFIFMFIFIILIKPYNLSDPDNFIPANPLSTPAHIQPEWYFLFAYTILRSIPNKLGGVMALLLSILIFFFLPFMNKKNLKSNHFYFLNKYLFWFFVTLLMILTWLGSQPVESPFIFTGQMCTILYFSFFFINSMTFVLWDFIIFK